jgi:hypothetical protein
MSKLKNKPLTKSSGSYYEEKWSVTTAKSFHAVFFHVGAIWAPRNGTKKVLKGLHVGRTYGPMCKLKNKPLTKFLGLFFKEKRSETTRKQVFMLGFFSLHFGAILVPLNGSKKVPKHLLVGGMYGPLSKLKNKPLTKLLDPLF